MNSSNQNPIESAVPDWPRTQRNRNHWIGLHKHGFLFTHEPSFELDYSALKKSLQTEGDDFDARRDYFCVPSAEYRKLRSILENSQGGSVLVTGYRGTGKSSLVKYTLERLKGEYNQRKKNRGEPSFLDLRLNLSSVSRADQVLPMMFKALYDGVCVVKRFDVPLWIRNEIRNRFYAATHHSKHRTLANIPLAPGRASGVESERERGPSSTAEMQADLATCVDFLFEEKIKTVFIFDEIDKIQPAKDEPKAGEERLKQLQNIVGELKFILTETNAYHVFIAGKDVDDSWQEDQNKGEGLFESIFTLNIYLPSFFTPRLEYTLGPHRKWIMERINRSNKEFFSEGRTTQPDPTKAHSSLHQKVFRKRELTRSTRLKLRFFGLLLRVGEIIIVFLTALIPFSLFLWMANLNKSFDILEIFGPKISAAVLILFYLVSLFLSFRLLSFVFVGWRRTTGKWRQPRTRLVKEKWREWVANKRAAEGNEYAQRDLQDMETFVIDAVAAELGISQKNWTFRTALLVIPHLAEYEIQGFLLRRYLRFKQKDSHEEWPEGFKQEARNRDDEIRRLKILVEDLVDRDIPLPSQRKIARFKMFIQFATYKGRGIPRKILREFYSYVRHRSVIREHQFKPEYWDKRDDVDFVLNIPHVIQQKMSFFADITAHLEREIHFFRNLDDKGIVSTFHIVDFMLKFYETGFSRRDIYNANFMIRRQELFPSEPLVERVIEIFSGFLITPLSQTSPFFRLLPRVQSDLATLYLNFGPDQLELRFARSEFNDELKALEMGSLGHNLENDESFGMRIESFRVESRKGRVHELIGDYLMARICYGRAIRWVFSDFDNILKNTERLKSPISNSIDSGRMISFSSQAMELLCRLARIHDVMHELHESLLYYNQAISLGLRMSETYREVWDKDLEPEDWEDWGNESSGIENMLIQCYPCYTQDELKSLKLRKGSRELLELSRTFLLGNKAFRDIVFGKDFVIHPEIAGGEPTGVVSALNSSAIIHEKLGERTTANEALLIGLFYLSSAKNDYGVIDQLILMGNLSVRRRNFPQALVAYSFAMAAINRIKEEKNDFKNRKNDYLPVSERLRATILCYLADLYSAMGKAVFSKAKALPFWNSRRENLRLEKVGNPWIFMRACAKGDYFDTRDDEFLYGAAADVFESIGERILVIDTHLKRLAIRLRRLRSEVVKHDEAWEKINEMRASNSKYINSFDPEYLITLDKLEKNIVETPYSEVKIAGESLQLLNTFSSILSSAVATLRRILHSTTEKGRLDASGQCDPITHRRLGRLFELVGLSLNVLSSSEELNLQKLLDAILGTSSPFSNGEIEELRREVLTKFKESFEFKEEIVEAFGGYTLNAEGFHKKGIDRALDFDRTRKNLELLLSHCLAKKVVFSEGKTEDWVEKLRPGTRSHLAFLSHSNSSDNNSSLLVDLVVNDLTDSKLRQLLLLSAERSLIFSILTYRRCIRDISYARANASLGRFYFSILVELFAKYQDATAFSSSEERFRIQTAARWLYLSSKRYLVKSVDTFRNTSNGSRRAESLLCEVYSCLAELMLFRRFLLERKDMDFIGKESLAEKERKELDDLCPLDVQNQAFRYGNLALETYARELSHYREGYPVPKTVHFDHRNINDSHMHFEICASVNRRRGSESIGLSEIGTRYGVEFPQGTHLVADYSKFLSDFSKVFKLICKVRIFANLIEIEKKGSDYDVKPTARSPRYVTKACFFSFEEAPTYEEDGEN